MTEYEWGVQASGKPTPMPEGQARHVVKRAKHWPGTTVLVRRPVGEWEVVK